MRYRILKHNIVIRARGALSHPRSLFTIPTHGPRAYRDSRRFKIFGARGELIGRMYLLLSGRVPGFQRRGGKASNKGLAQVVEPRSIHIVHSSTNAIPAILLECAICSLDEHVGIHNA